MFMMLAFFMILVAIGQMIPPIVILALGVFFLQKRNRKRKQEEVKTSHWLLLLFGVFFCIGGAIYFTYSIQIFWTLFQDAIHFKFLTH